ncbi:hypothetical protein AAGR22_21855 (plasmid) [Erwinia sp. HDF1-3R]|jgi:hypothetical protein|uniref:hypothetical protein n=1 Tax=Erwiniaceae TaxID=1903409 RepID=UPI001CC02524|nr:hypothetical protein [Pantoea agglomerans]HBS0497635.1 hypothetical protein [Klebsiella pneumoniae]
MSHRMNIKAVYVELSKKGHLTLWFKVEHEPGVRVYLSISSADERELAWWDYDSSSWFLNKAAEHLCCKSTELKEGVGDELDDVACDLYQALYHC